MPLMGGEWVVYALIEADGRFYVGVSRMVRHRWWKHRAARGLGLLPMVVLEVVDRLKGRPALYDAERAWIRRMLSWGLSLSNLSKVPVDT